MKLALTEAALEDLRSIRAYTLEFLILWQERNGIADERMGQLLQSTFRFARFRPPASHPNYTWWQRCWGV